MVMFDTTHICFLLITIAFLTLSTLAVSRMSALWQNVMFFLAAFLCAGGIFFRYGMNLSFDGGFDFKTLATQMMQVCNFNFILVILMLIPGCELARQYAVFFSAAAACTTFVSISGTWANHNWYDLTVINSWCNHVFAVALPLWMVAARRLKPKKYYIWQVMGLVFIYFTVSYIVCSILIGAGVLPAGTSFSFLFETGKIGLLDMLWSLIPVPYFYLYPLMLLLFGFFWVWARLFRDYKTELYHL